MRLRPAERRSVRTGVSAAQHVGAFAAITAFGYFARLGPIYYGAMVLVAVALVYEHRSARRLDILGINRAFFQSNAFVSAVFLLAVCLDRLL